MDLDSLRSPLDAETLRDGLVGPGLSWRQLDVVAETGSTNADLLARAEAGAEIDGSVLLAEYQSAGGGRQGRQWSAPPRAQVALSVGVAGGSVPRTGWGWLPLATGVAVADALAAVGPSLLMLGSSATERNALARSVLRELAMRIDAWRTAGGADPALVAD